jgi:hypothetical protein
MQTIGVWGLREEARESWDYFVSNKIVYFPESCGGDLELPHTFAEKYLHGNGWLEMHFTGEKQHQGEVHFNVIVEVSDVGSPHFNGRGKANVKLGAVRGNSSMFVHVPEFIQLPEGVVPKGIFSQVRLKVVENICHCGWEKTAPLLVSGVPLLEDEKANSFLLSRRENSLGIRMSQPPSQLLKRGTEAAYEVSQQEGDGFRDESRTYVEYVERFFKICILPDGAVLGRGEPLGDFFFQCAKVLFRPVGLHLNFLQDIALRDGHNANSLMECGSISA